MASDCTCARGRGNTYLLKSDLAASKDYGNLLI